MHYWRLHAFQALDNLSFIRVNVMFHESFIVLGAQFDICLIGDFIME